MIVHSRRMSCRQLARGPSQFDLGARATLLVSVINRDVEKVFLLLLTQLLSLHGWRVIVIGLRNSSIGSLLIVEINLRS